MGRSCGICGSDKYDIVRRQKFVLPTEFKLAEEYDLVKCADCGFIYSNSSSSLSDYEEYYELMSKYENQDDIYKDFIEVFTEEKYYTLNLVRSLIVDKSKRIVEFGCANGVLLSMLKEDGYINIKGVDPSSRCVEYMKSKGILAEQGFINNNIIEKGSCDLIILEGVLEHVFDLKETISKLYDCLSYDGKLLILVPDADSYGENYVAPYYYLDIEHINHFGRNDFKNISSIYGMKYSELESYYFTFKKDIRVPVLSVCLEKAIDLTRNQIANTNDTLESIRTHLRDSEIKMAMIDKIISNIDRDKELSIYGVGNNTFRILANSTLKDKNIVRFIDNDTIKQGLTICDKKIFPHDRIFCDDSTIILCTAYSNQVIYEKLEKLGVGKRVIDLDI